MKNDRRQRSTEYDQQASLFRQGDETALAFFYHEFYPSLTLYAFKFLHDLPDAQEIANDAFVNTWPHRAKLNSFGAIRAYLYKAVHHACIRHRQKNGRVIIGSLEPGQQRIADDDRTAYDILIEAETARQVRAALQHLPPACRQVMELHYLEGLSLAEIAVLLRKAGTTIRTQKKAGLKALKNSLFRLGILLFACCW